MFRPKGLKSVKQETGKSNEFDRFQTPEYALSPLWDFIPRHWVVWECAQGNGNIVTAFRKRGYQVVGTDILTGTNFFNHRPDSFDCVVTNPPYSIKTQWLMRCYQLGRPFALLMPITSFEQRNCEMFSKYGIEILMPIQRINFETPTGEGSGSWFKTVWFTHGLNIGRDITYCRLIREKQVPPMLADQSLGE